MGSNRFMSSTAAGSGGSTRDRATAYVKLPMIFPYIDDHEHRKLIFNHFKNAENCDDFVNTFTGEDRVTYLENILFT